MDTSVKQPDIVQQQPEKIEKPQVSKKKYIIAVVVGLMLIVPLILALFLTNKNKTTVENKPGAEKTEVLPPDNFFKTSVLSSPISDLELKSLPNSRLIRGIVYYKNSLWVTGDGSLIEYDSITNKIKRFSDPKLARCDSNLAIVRDFMYVPCRNLSEATEEDQLPPYSIYKINLKTLKLEKILTDKDGLKNRENFRIYSDRDYLWLATFEGVARISTKTDEIKFFTNELGIKDYGGEVHYGINSIYVGKDYVWAVVSANVYSTGGVSKFDKKTQTWTPYGPSEIHGEGADTRIDFDALKLVDGGIRVVYDHFPSNKQIEKEYSYSKGTWETLNNQFDTTGENYEQGNKYVDDNYKSQSDYAKEDSDRAIQIYSKDGGNKNQINGRAFLWMSELTNNKRYLITSSSLDVLKSGDKYPNIVFNFGKNIDFLEPHSTLPDIKFLNSPDNLYAFVIDPAYYPGFESPEVWEKMSIWVIDLKTDVVKEFTSDNRYDWRRNFKYDDALVGSGGKDVLAETSGDLIKILMDGTVIMEYNIKNQTLEFKGSIVVQQK